MAKQAARAKRSTPTPRPSIAPVREDVELDVPFRMALGIYFALGVIFFLPAFLPDQGIFGTDYLAGSYQFMEFLSNELRSGVIPKWVPYVYGGVPPTASNWKCTGCPTNIAGTASVWNVSVLVVHCA